MSDPIAQLLRSVRLTGCVFLDVHMTAPWCVTSQITTNDVAPYLANPRHVIGYHYVISGEMLANVGDGPATRVQAGEIVMMPRNDPHVLASEPGIPPIDPGALVEPGADGGLARIVHGGGGAPTHIVCGFLGSEDFRSPLLAALPSMVKLDVREGASRDWVEASLRYAADEFMRGRFAPSAVMAQLSELMLAEAIRSYSDTGDNADGRCGWLKGINDPQIGRALDRIHTAYAETLTVEALADAAALSRSTFVERFTSLVGMPPIRYLTRWRLQAACRHLTDTNAPVARIAGSVGYESEEAFSRAFKREYGQSPSRWRDRGGNDGQTARFA